MQLNYKARHMVVQVVMLASATLSASYYASQAPALHVALGSFAVNPVAIGLGMTAFALDMAKPQMLRVAGTAGNGFVRRAAAAIVFGVLFVASMIAVDGVLMRLRSDWAADRGNAISAHTTAKADYDRVFNEVVALGEPRPVAEINAAINAVKIDMGIWRRSRQCQDITLDDSKQACQPVLTLLQERGRAARKVELEPELKAARDRFVSIQPPKAADPQAEALAKAFGLQETVIAYLMIAIIGFAVELVACLGLWLLDTRPVRREAAPENLTAEQQALAWVLGEMAKGGGKLTVLNTAVAAKFGVDPATATRWRQRWIEAGRVAEERDGRQIVLRTAR